MAKAVNPPESVESPLNSQTQQLPDIEDQDLSGLDRSFSDAAKAAGIGNEEQASPSPQGGSVVPPPAEPSISSAFQAAQGLGLDVSGYKTDEELIQSLYGQLKDAAPYVDYARQLLPYNERIQQALQPQQPPQPQPQAAPEPEWNEEKYFEQKWGGVKYDKGWDQFLQSGMIQIDPNTGHYVPVKEYANVVPLPVLQGLNEYRAWQRNGLEKLLTNPYRDTWEAFQEPLQRFVQDQIKRSLGQYDDTQSLSGWEAQNAKLLYEHNPTGKIEYDIYGNPVPTKYGAAFIGAARELRQAGINDPMRIIELAGRMAASHLPSLDPSPSPPAVQQQQDPAPPAEKPKPESFLQQAMHRASSSGYAEDGDVDQYVQSTRELDNMFMDAARKSGVVSKRT